MNSMVMEFAKSMLMGFDYIEIKTEEHKEEVEAFKKKMMDFAEGIDDPTTFHEKLAASGLQEESMNLMSKITMAGMAEEQKEEGQEKPLNKLPTVKEFVDQYKTPYETVKAAGYKKRTEKAYEDIFKVSEETEDMQEAQLKFEGNRLLWNIVKTDFIDTYEAMFEATDPLYLHLHEQFAMYLNLYADAKSDGEITYLMEKIEYPIISIQAKETTIMTIILSLGKLMDAYYKGKLAVWAWENDEIAKSGLSAIVKVRKAMPRVLKFLKEHLDLTFDDILSDEGLKVYLQYFVHSDEMFRIKAFPHHQNFKAYKWILENEILSDKTTLEILTDDPKEVWWPPFEGTLKEETESVYLNKINELNSQLSYFKYRKGEDFKRPEIVKTKEDVEKIGERANKL